MTPNENEWVSIGRVTAPHGLRGEVRVAPLTDAEDRFEHIDKVYIQASPHGQRRLVYVTRVAYRKNLVILGFKEVTHIDQAEQLRNALLQVPMDEVAPLPEATYYVFQLIGLRVEDVDGVYVGTVADVISGNGANDVYVVEREGHEPALIPAVHEFVCEINLEHGRMTIKPIPGLL